MKLRVLAAALALSVYVLGASAPTAMAECMHGYPGRTSLTPITHAFIATVTEASDDVDPEVPTFDPFDWHVELSVDKVYRGDVPDQLTFNGWEESCHVLDWSQLETGDRVFVMSNMLVLDRPPFEPLWKVGVMALAWRDTAQGWTFMADALADASHERLYPTSARRATTTSEIVHLLSPSAPQTDTVRVDATKRAIPSLFPLVSGLVTLLLVLSGVLRRSQR